MLNRELEFVISYLLENSYVNTIEEAINIIPHMSDSWIQSSIDIFEQYDLSNTILEMRKEDKVAGKTKTSPWAHFTKSKIDRAPEGSKNKWEKKTINYRLPDRTVGLIRAAQGKGPIDRATGMKHLPLGTPHLHGEGGAHRGKKKRDQPPAYDWTNPAKVHRPNDVRSIKANIDFKKNGPNRGTVGEYAYQKIMKQREEEAKRPSFKKVSQDWSTQPKKKSAAERMKAAADKLGIKD
jgi:hypothetical protein